MDINKREKRQFRCSSCGGDLELHNQRSKYISCPYCGSVAQKSDDAYKIISKNENPKKFKPRSFLKLGMTGDFNNEKYKIIGRTCWSSYYKEYWREGGESGYSSESWTFDDWLLIGENGDYKTIIEDADGFAISESFVPKYPVKPEGEKVKDFNNNKNRRVTEYGNSEILYYEGESTYLVKPGDSAMFSQYNYKDADYIAEWRYDGSYIKEIEFFKETSISAGKLRYAFINDESIAKQIEGNVEIYKAKRTRKRIFAYAGLINLIIGIFLASYYTDDNFNNTLFAYEFYAQQGVSQTGWQAAVEKDWKKVDIVHTKKFKITPEYENLTISAKYHVPDKDFEGRYTIFLMNSKGEALFTYSQFNYNYDNYAFSGEEAHNDFRLEETFSLNKLDEYITAAVVFEVPNTYIKEEGKPIGIDLKISTAKTEFGLGGFIFIGVILLVVSLATKKGEKPVVLNKKTKK